MLVVEVVAARQCGQHVRVTSSGSNAAPHAAPSSAAKIASNRCRPFPDGSLCSNNWLGTSSMPSHGSDRRTRRSPWTWSRSPRRRRPRCGAPPCRPVESGRRDRHARGDRPRAQSARQRRGRSGGCREQVGDVRRRRASRRTKPAPSPVVLKSRLSIFARRARASVAPPTLGGGESVDAAPGGPTSTSVEEPAWPLGIVGPVGAVRARRHGPPNFTLMSCSASRLRSSNSRAASRMSWRSASRTARASLGVSIGGLARMGSVARAGRAAGLTGGAVDAARPAAAAAVAGRERQAGGRVHAARRARGGRRPSRRPWPSSRSRLTAGRPAAGSGTRTAAPRGA